MKLNCKILKWICDGIALLSLRIKGDIVANFCSQQTLFRNKNGRKTLGSQTGERARKVVSMM